MIISAYVLLNQDNFIFIAIHLLRQSHEYCSCVSILVLGIALLDPIVMVSKTKLPQVGQSQTVHSCQMWNQRAVATKSQESLLGSHQRKELQMGHKNIQCQKQKSQLQYRAKGFRLLEKIKAGDKKS